MTNPATDPSPPETTLAIPKPQLTIQQESAFDNTAAFANGQRMATLLSSSKIIPESFRNNIPDCLIAMEMSKRIGANVLSVMQNLYIVHGKPAWSSQFLISCVNASNKFTPLRYKMTGTKDTDSFGCIAWALDRSGEQLESPEVTVKIAKQEGWFQKNGSKWQTMPELMLRYRAATLFARLFAPELTMGITTDDEVIDITPIVTEPIRMVSKPKSEKPTEPKPVEVVTTPADAPTTETLQQELARHATAAGVTFEQYREWGFKNAQFGDAVAVKSWDEVPRDQIARLLRGKNAAFAKIKEGK